MKYFKIYIIIVIDSYTKQIVCTAINKFTTYNICKIGFIEYCRQVIKVVIAMATVLKIVTFSQLGSFWAIDGLHLKSDLFFRGFPKLKLCFSERGLKIS